MNKDIFSYEEFEEPKGFWTKVCGALMIKNEPVRICANILKNGEKISWVKRWNEKQVQYAVRMLNKHYQQPLKEKNKK